MEMLQQLHMAHLEVSSSAGLAKTSFKSLVSLSLSNVRIDAPVLGRLLLRAEKLEILRLNECSFMGEAGGHLLLSSLKLKSLTVRHSGEYLKSIRVEGATRTSLERLELCSTLEMSTPGSSYEVLEGLLPKLRALKLCTSFLSGQLDAILSNATAVETLMLGRRDGRDHQSEGLLNIIQRRCPSVVDLDVHVDCTSPLLNLGSSVALAKLRRFGVWVCLNQDGTVPSETQQALLAILAGCPRIELVNVHLWHKWLSVRECRFNDFSRFLSRLQRVNNRVEICQFMEKDGNF
jgi:hypothetical protein